MLRDSEIVPFGVPDKIKGLAYTNWFSRLVVYSPVRNTVVLVNPATLPSFGFEVGKSSSYGIFTEQPLSQDPSLASDFSSLLEVWPTHHRSALKTRKAFQDSAGRVYRDVDLKGGGHVYNYTLDWAARDLVIGNPGEAHSSGGRSGLIDWKEAMTDYELSKQLTDLGVRTSKVLAVIKLEELIAQTRPLIINGESWGDQDDVRKISIQQMREEGSLPEDFVPVIEVRAFGTKARVQDLLEIPRYIVRDFGSLKRASGGFYEAFLADAMEIMRFELSQTRRVTQKQYLTWFARTLGANIGLMHRNGLSHNVLGEHNVTLDCRIVDLISLSEIKNKAAMEDDLDGGMGVLRTLESVIQPVSTLRRMFLDAYRSTVKG